MKLISWNVNGVRAVERKGALVELLNREKPDVLFLQETKARKEQLSNFLTLNEEYEQSYHSAQRAGYSGVSLWARKKSFGEVEVFRGMEGWDDTEGRVIGFRSSELVFIGVYFPNGGKSEEAWREKLRFYDHFLEWVNALRSSGKRVVWCGDLNVAHNEIDLARPKENEGNIGFRPEERSWVDRVCEANWVDVFRQAYPETSSYTWWSMQTRARERDIGWRIDYFFVDSPDLDLVKSTAHLNQQMGSDHCPITLELDL